MKSDQPKADIWMPLYVADYVADTPYLTTEQHGAYLLLLMAYWRNGPPPDNDAILASLVKMAPDAWSIARAVLVRYFEVCEGFWIHKRVEVEMEKAKRNRATAHDKASKAAKAKWEKARMLQALPEHVLEQCPSPSPSTTPTKPHQEQSATPPVADAPPLATGKARKPKAVGQRKPLMTIDEWLADCKAKDEKTMPATDPIFEWAADAGIPIDYLRLAWLVFLRDWKAKKPQQDWRATYRNAVRQNWLKLWFFHADGDCRLTTTGEQERRAHE